MRRIIATRTETELGKRPQCDTNRFLAVGRGSEVEKDGRNDSPLPPDERSILLTELFRRQAPTERHCLAYEIQALEKGDIKGQRNNRAGRRKVLYCITDGEIGNQESSRAVSCERSLIITKTLTHAAGQPSVTFFNLHQNIPLFT